MIALYLSTLQIRPTYILHNNLTKIYLLLGYFSQNKILIDNLIPNKIMSLPKINVHLIKKKRITKTNSNVRCICKRKRIFAFVASKNQLQPHTILIPKMSFVNSEHQIWCCLSTFFSFSICVLECNFFNRMNVYFRK